MANYTQILPPQATDIEKAVLGAALMDRRATDDMLMHVSSEEVFYEPKHQWVFKAIKRLMNASAAVDLMTVSQELRSMKKLEELGGDIMLIGLVKGVASGAHMEHHCRILLQKYMARKVISICNHHAALASDPQTDVFDLMDALTGSLDSLTDQVAGGHISSTWEDAMLSIPKRVEFLTNNQGNVTGIPTGLKAMDRIFSGWQNQDLVVIGADSGMGKTALVMCNMLAAAKEGYPVGMFSMEMSVIQLAIRSVAVSSEFHMNQLMRNGFEHDYYFEKLNRIVHELKDYPVHIDDQPALTVMEMKRKARAMKRKHNIKLLVVDFVQMFSGDKDVRMNISEAARELKNIAKELNIPVIALSQLSREVKKERYKLPSKHHLKESSAIEEAADVIALLYRPGYYGYRYETTPDLWQDLHLQPQENACLIVAKNRNGSLGNVGLNYVENKTKFVNPEDADSYVMLNESGQVVEEGMYGDDNPF